VVIAVLDGADADSGTAFEMGVAHAMGKPIVGVRTDYRAGAEHGVNIMCSRACRYMVREFAFQENPKVVAEAIVRRLRKIRKTLVG
jgi:nucleoside 2-deoxyribosyltransferase